MNSAKHCELLEALRVYPRTAISAEHKSRSMCLALFAVALYAFAALPRVTSQFPLAVGGHGTFFYKPGIPLANARVWVEVFAPSEWMLNKPYVWTNATSADKNVSEVRVHPDTGEYELEALVGDASRRSDIKAIRLFFERVQDVIGDFCDCRCFGRDLGLEYMYLYKPDRKPTRSFRYDVMLDSPEPNDRDQALVSVDEVDTCFHHRLAARARGRLMCNKTMPMVDGNVSARIKISGNWSKFDGISDGMTDANGTYEFTVWAGDVADRHDIDEIRLVVFSMCTSLHQQFTAKLPLDYLYVHDPYVTPTAFVFDAQLDVDHLHPGER